MEFDKNTPVSDEQRRLAETKKVTLEPIHTNVEPEDISDAQIAARHVSDSAVGNAPNDMEQSHKVPATASAQIATPKTHASPAKVMAGVIVGLCLIVTVAILFMTAK